MLTTRDCVSPLGGTGMPERRTADPLEPYVERLIENMEANADDSATGNSALSSDFAAWGLSRCIVSFRHFFDHDHLHEQGVSLTGPLRLSEDQAEGALQTIMVFYLYLTCTSEQGDSVARKVLRIRPTELYASVRSLWLLSDDHDERFNHLISSPVTDDDEGSQRTVLNWLLSNCQSTIGEVEVWEETGAWEVPEDGMAKLAVLTLMDDFGSFLREFTTLEPRPYPITVLIRSQLEGSLSFKDSD